MLLFLNFDCVLAPPADDAGPGSGGASGVRRLEGLLRDWPHVRIVVTSGRRYRLTLAHFRSFVAAEFRHRLIATTLLYGRGTQAVRRRTREDEVLDWLEAARCEHADWLALDSGRHDYVEHADRLLLCTTLTHSAVARLHCELLRRSRRAIHHSRRSPVAETERRGRPLQPAAALACHGLFTLASPCRQLVSRPLADGSKRNRVTRSQPGLGLRRRT